MRFHTVNPEVLYTMTIEHDDWSDKIDTIPAAKECGCDVEYWQGGPCHYPFIKITGADRRSVQKAASYLINRLGKSVRDYTGKP